MDHESAARISAAAARDPDSPTATSGFDDRAQEAAGRNDAEDSHGTRITTSSRCLVLVPAAESDGGHLCARRASRLRAGTGFPPIG